MIRFFFLTVALINLPSQVLAQSFSCRFGAQPACLDYGDTVCSSLGKCVSSDAVCFDSYQCNYEGFTCKSHLTDCGDQYDDLLKKHNYLVDDYNELLEEAHRLRSVVEEAANCIRYSSSLSEAQSCSYLLE